jgi:hypothetical protein
MFKDDIQERQCRCERRTFKRSAFFAFGVNAVLAGFGTGPILAATGASTAWGNAFPLALALGGLAKALTLF